MEVLSKTCRAESLIPEDSYEARARKLGRGESSSLARSPSVEQLAGNQIEACVAHLVAVVLHVLDSIELG